MVDVRNHLVAQLERLSNKDLTPEELEKEHARAQAITMVTEQYINSAKVEVDFIKAVGGSTLDSELFDKKQIGNK